MFHFQLGKLLLYGILIDIVHDRRRLFSCHNHI